MRRLARAAAAAAGAAGCLALAGCGGGHSATKQDVIARANGICVNTLRQVRAVPPPKGTSLAALATYTSKVVPIVQKEASDTRALPRPTSGRTVLDRYVAAVGDSATQYRNLATAARKGDAAGVSQALAALRNNAAQTFAKQYGMTECLTSAGT